LPQARGEGGDIDLPAGDRHILARYLMRLLGKIERQGAAQARIDPQYAGYCHRASPCQKTPEEAPGRPTFILAAGVAAPSPKGIGG
jgi:hypothetical protein